MDQAERDTLEQAITPLADARHTAASSLDAATSALREAVMDALNNGASELWLHKLTGLSRNTIRTWRAEATRDL